MQLERTQSAPGTTQHAGEKVLRMPRETSGKTPTLDSRGMREQRGHPTAKTQHTTFFTFTVLLNTMKLYTLGYIRIKMKNNVRDYFQTGRTDRKKMENDI